MTERLNTGNWSEIYKSVKGWVGERIDIAIRSIDAIQQSKAVRGHIVEIGVHHGKFFLLIDQMRKTGEKSFAFDIFDS